MKRALIGITIGALVAVALALATVVVLRRLNPSNELRRMFFAMSRVTAFETSLAFSWTKEDAPKNRVTTTMYTKGNGEMKQGKMGDYDMMFRAVEVYETGSDKDISGEIRKQGDRFYLTYTPPGPEGFPVFSLKETWISFSPDERKKWGPLIPGVEIPFFVPFLWNEGSQDITQQLGLLSRLDLFRVLHAEARELIGKVETRVFDVRLEPDIFRTFLLEIIRMRDGHEPTDEERLLVEDQTILFQRLSIRLWIGVQDHLVYRLQTSGDGGDMLATFVYKDYFSPRHISGSFLPFSSLTIKPVLPHSQNISSDFSDTSFSLKEDIHLPVGEDRTETTEISNIHDKDQDGLTDLLEVFYGTNAENSDTDGDGQTDGEEVLQGTNPRGKGSLFGFGLESL